MSFWAGGRRVDGDLTLPAGGGPHPVVLVVHGSPTLHRDHFPLLDGLAVAGIASLSWTWADDVRPPPDPRRERVDHARDVLSAADRLRGVPEVDETSMGLVGWGDGGWAAAQAVTFSNQFRALVLAGTPTVTPSSLIEHAVLCRVRAAGFTDSDVAVARDAVRGWMAAVAEGVTPSGADGPLAEYRALPWFGELAASRELGAASPGVLLADPLPTLSAVGIPVLALFGEQDPTLPLAECVRGLRTVLRRAGNVDHQAAVIRGADRVLRVRASHGLGGMDGGCHRFGEWPAGLVQALAGWLTARLRSVCDVPAFVPPTPGRAARLKRAGRAPFRRLPVRQVRRRIDGE
jgi:hypothetical protein